MSALGQKPTCAPQKVMSALALIVTSNVTYGMCAKGQRRWDRHRVSVSGGFRNACSSDTPPHQNRLVFRLACPPSLDGSRVERACSRRRCKQSVAVQQWQPCGEGGWG